MRNLVRQLRPLRLEAESRPRHRLDAAPRLLEPLRLRLRLRLQPRKLVQLPLRSLDGGGTLRGVGALAFERLERRLLEGN